MRKVIEEIILADMVPTRLKEQGQDITKGGLVRPPRPCCRKGLITGEMGQLVKVTHRSPMA